MEQNKQQLQCKDCESFMKMAKFCITAGEAVNPGAPACEKGKRR
jgi:hypothetical protein